MDQKESVIFNNELISKKIDVDEEINLVEIFSSILRNKKIVLIFDECTTGFRENLGGIHLKYKIKPDICILGKALGNGYSINAIIGKKKI